MLAATIRTDSPNFIKYISGRYDCPKKISCDQPIVRLSYVHTKDISKLLKNKFSNWFCFLETINDLNWQIQLDNLINIVHDYVNLPNNWDGYEGVAPKIKAVRDCISIIKHLPEAILLPKPMVSGTGIVGLYWEKNMVYAEICFEGDGTFWYYGTKDNLEIGEESVSLDKEIQFPENLLNLIKII